MTILLYQVRNRAKLERMREVVVRESRKRVEKMKEMIESMEQVIISSVDMVTRFKVYL